MIPTISNTRHVYNYVCHPVKKDDQVERAMGLFVSAQVLLSFKIYVLYNAIFFIETFPPNRNPVTGYHMNTVRRQADTKAGKDDSRGGSLWLLQS